MKNTAITRDPNYSDLDLDFFANPSTGDVVKKNGIEAIKRSVRNLILTNFYERPFRSYVGSDVPRYLFDQVDPITLVFMKSAIEDVINNFEPRVKLTNVVINNNIDNNGFDVRIEYIILNRELPVTVNYFLERIR